MPRLWIPGTIRARGHWEPVITYHDAVPGLLIATRGLIFFTHHHALQFLLTSSATLMASSENKPVQEPKPMEVSSEEGNDTELETEESDESETKGPNLCVRMVFVMK